MHKTTYTHPSYIRASKGRSLSEEHARELRARFHATQLRQERRAIRQAKASFLGGAL